MRLRRCTYALPVVAVAALLSACSSTPARPPSTRVASGAARSTVDGTTSTTDLTSTGNVHLTAYTDNDGPTSTVILSGSVGDYGRAQSVNPDGSINAEHSSQLNLVLTRGSFRLDIADLDRRFVAALAGLRLNTATCSGTASVSAPVGVVPGSGTGSYKGIRGTFLLAVTLDEVDQPNGCGASSPYLAQAIVISGSGTVSVG